MTELTWEGKYKDDKKVAPVRIALPFQTIETVNESVQDRQRTLDMFADGKPTEWRNRLIWGDKKYVLPSLLPEFAGKVNLIYIDPPFDTGADFSFTATIPDNPETEEVETTNFLKEPSIIEQKAYRDTWGHGLDSYVQWFYETVALLREMLAEDGSIYVHLDWHVGHYVKAVMDEVFGYENFRADIIWEKIRIKKAQSSDFPNVHDMILKYGKSEKVHYVHQYVSLSEEYIESHYSSIEEKTGRRYQLISMIQGGSGPPRRFGKKTIAAPQGKHWIWSQERIDEAWKNNLIVITSGGMPRLKKFLDESKGVNIGDLWNDIAPVNSQAIEATGYGTQKPAALLERIIEASSNDGDLVLDCFVGSGTTAAVAEKLNRRWIACDLSRFAVHVTRKRLLQISYVRPFVVQNLGKYERQAWQASEFPDPQDRASQEKGYRNFILGLYHAEPIKGFVWLHGAKEARMVHVGAVDAPVALGDVKAIVQEFWKSVGKPIPFPEGEAQRVRVNGVDILGWEFAFDINETARQQAAASKVDVKFKKIPREVLDKRAVEQGDVHFFELAGLDVKVKKQGKKVELGLKEFVIPPDDVPEDVRTAITHWSQWIDYWAVDWNYREDTFHNEWQTYRTKKNPKIELSTTHQYEENGRYTIVVKVIDILGNDTTKAIRVEMGLANE
jgi:adenine-specific DNA-methyltransferase